MIKFLFILFACCIMIISAAQEIPESKEQNLENLTENLETETEDDSYLLALEKFKKHRINLNTAEGDELRELKILSGLQIAGFLSYRNLLGKFIDIYELQAIPFWDIAIIRKLIPYITLEEPELLKDEISKRLRDGDHGLLIRFSQVLQKTKGFDHSVPGIKYSGSPQKILLRYRYSYKNLFQYGFVADKDAGEQFFKGAQINGFDFYSFHLFARKTGKIEALAIGDYTVNLGQGLIQWQNLSFKKSVDITGIKRQSAVLRPYNSAGEYNFHRGAGITLKFKKIEASYFVSSRKLSANFMADTINNEDYISSFLTSGYHRTNSEIADRNILRQTATGGNIKYRTERLHFGFNTIAYWFSLPVQKSDEPYNLHAIHGRNWNNLSIDFSFTYKNIHFFGEAASDKNKKPAIINGLLISVDPRVDIALLHRSINKKFQSINSYAFTENTFPTNEKGLYAGISIRPATMLRIDAYADFYQFPWLKYLVDAPSYGKDFLVQLTYAPNKQAEMYLKYKNESKQINQPGNTTVSNLLVTIPRQSLRTQLQYKINASFTLRNRIELLWYDHRGNNQSNGFMTFFDIIYKPQLKPFSGNLRVQYFETDDYNSRIYAYENHVLYNFSIPVFFEKGYRYYLNLNYDFNQKISIWLKWAQFIYPEKKSIGTGLDEIIGNQKTEIKLQALKMF